MSGRAARGAMVVLGGSAGVRALGLLANVVLARLLTPTDFGLIAIALTVRTIINTFSDAGVSAALIRGAREPTAAQLRATVGLQLLVTTAIIAVAVGITAPFGKVGTVTAIGLAGSLTLAFRSPGRVALERQVAFGRVVVVDVVSYLAYLAVGIPAVIAGAGVYGLALGMSAGDALGTLMMLASSSRGALPSLRLGPLRSVLRFGLMIQATVVVLALRDQAIAAGTLAIAGAATLGIWALTTRFLAIPSVVIEALSRVGYPAMARRVEAGGDARPFVARFTAALAVAIGLVSVLLVAGARPGVPALLGRRWTDVAVVLALSAPTFILEGPVRVAASTYLYAIGDARTYLQADVIQAVVLVVVGLTLVAPLDASGLAIAYTVAAGTRAVLLSRALRHDYEIVVGRSIVMPLAIATAVTLPLFLASSSEPSFLDAAALSLAGGVGYCALTWLVHRDAARLLIVLARRAMPG